MVSWGYIDDSTKGDSLVLSCAIIESSAGFWLERDWKSVIHKKNAELTTAGRPIISRFHGADCNACNREFRGWDKEKDQIPFIQSLQAQIRKYRINSIGHSVRIADVAEVFPEAKSGARALAHVVLLCFLLTTIADQIRISWANSDILNIIADALVEEGVDRSTFGFSPFPIEMPDRLPDFLPTSVVCYTTVCEPRNEQKIERLRNLRYTVIVLYREQPKKISGSVIREDIVVGGEVWKTMVPNATVRAIAELDLRNRQKILRSSGIDSKL